MAQLAIGGHPTRGKEVIEILKMFGGKVYIEEIYKGEYPDRYYYVNKNDGFINSYFSETVDIINDFQTFTLEEFLEKFPYKVGDKAFAFGNKCTIIDAVWDGGIDEVVYTIKLDASKYTTTILSNQLQPYKEEVMAEANKAVFDANAQCCDIMNNLIKEETMKEQIVTEDITLEKAVMCTFREMVEGKQRLRIAMNEGFELKEENGNFFVYKKKGEYPKTYEECSLINGCDNRISLKIIGEFTRLINARNAYWKIAGEQMGLDKPWEPNWDDGNEFKYGLYHFRNGIMYDGSCINPTLLAFPTEEMRDAFYENFKDLIIECKELL